MVPSLPSIDYFLFHLCTTLLSLLLELKLGLHLVEVVWHELLELQVGMVSVRKLWDDLHVWVTVVEYGHHVSHPLLLCHITGV